MIVESLAWSHSIISWEKNCFNQTRAFSIEEGSRSFSTHRRMSVSKRLTNAFTSDKCMQRGVYCELSALSFITLYSICRSARAFSWVWHTDKHFGSSSSPNPWQNVATRRNERSARPLLRRYHHVWWWTCASLQGMDESAYSVARRKSLPRVFRANHLWWRTHSLLQGCNQRGPILNEKAVPLRNSLFLPHDENTQTITNVEKQSKSVCLGT